MKISYKWLKQYANTEIKPEEVSKILTDIGLEVESLEIFETIKGGLRGVVTGEVINCERHPNADKLSVCKVDIGAEALLNIVCGAPNVAKGQKVLVATLGTTLYTPKGEITMQKAKIRGEFSEGMICAPDELQLGESHEGIMVLSPETKIGQKAADYFNIEEDYIFTIGLTPNRNDAASHLGVARDFAAAVNFSKREDIKIDINYKELLPDSNEEGVTVEVQDNVACPRYSGITIRNIEVKESPEWLKNLLLSIGVRPINNIVDITNFILHDMGQPLHAFDADKIAGGKVIVKKLPQDTLFVTLDEVERKLSSNDLMICDANGGMCIAGVFGGINSGVSYETKNIFIESACFDAVHVRKTSKYHTLKTDSAFRFERGTDINITVDALKKCATMIKEMAGGTLMNNIVDIYPTQKVLTVIPCKYSSICRTIGKNISKEEIDSILTSLDIEVIKNKEGNDDMFNAVIPSYRAGFTHEADVTEEVIRIYGFNNIELPEISKSFFNIASKPDNFKIQNILSDMLIAEGYSEIMCNSLSKSEYIKLSADHAPESYVKLENPLSKDNDTMRQTMLYGGMEAIVYNQNRRSSNLKFFEFGKTYRFDLKEDRKSYLDNFSDCPHLCLFITGKNNSEMWNNTNEAVDFYHLKTSVLNIMTRLGIKPSKLKLSDEKTSDIYDYSLTYLFNNQPLVTMGKINNKLNKYFDIKADVYYADFRWDTLLKLSTFTKVLYSELPKFPEVRRDLALLIKENVKYSEIEAMAWNLEKKLLKEVNLFDVYQGEKIEKGYKSYAVSFIFQDNEKTLTDKEVDSAVNKFIRAYKEKLGAEIR